MVPVWLEVFLNLKLLTDLYILHVKLRVEMKTKPLLVLLCFSCLGKVSVTGVFLQVKLAVRCTPPPFSCEKSVDVGVTLPVISAFFSVTVSPTLLSSPLTGSHKSFSHSCMGTPYCWESFCMVPKKPLATELHHFYHMRSFEKVM